MYVYKYICMYLYIYIYVLKNKSVIDSINQNTFVVNQSPLAPQILANPCVLSPYF